MWLQPVQLYAHTAFGKAILKSETETLLSNQGTAEKAKEIHGARSVRLCG